MAYIVALAHIAGSGSLYAADGSRAAFLPPEGLGTGTYDTLLAQAETYLQSHSLEQFLAEAPPLLNREQKIAILASMTEVARASGAAAPHEHPIVAQCRAAFGIPVEQVPASLQESYVKPDAVLFPQ
jgi:hypothetical protein